MGTACMAMNPCHASGLVHVVRCANRANRANLHSRNIRNIRNRCAQ